MRAETLSLSSSWCPRQMNSSLSVGELVKTCEEVSQSWRLSKKDTTAKHKTGAGDRAEAWPADRLYHEKYETNSILWRYFLGDYNEAYFWNPLDFSSMWYFDVCSCVNLKANKWSASTSEEDVSHRKLVRYIEETGAIVVPRTSAIRVITTGDLSQHGVQTVECLDSFSSLLRAFRGAFTGFQTWKR